MRNPTEQPNIIIMYADDLGFGDVGCYGASAIPTPHIDRLAARGLKFHNGYATAATCTPSRYSLLTGSYPWRHSSAKILPGDAPLIIEEGSPTMPELLRQAGYRTGVIGKWHLGIGSGSVNWNQPIQGTPLDVGFDESYIMAATNDRVPCVYLDGREVENLDPNDPIEVSYQEENPWPETPTGRDNPELLKMMYSHHHDCSIVNGVSRIGYMRGGAAALWTDEDMADAFLGRALDFITANQDRPFFLYHAFHQPHVPRLPHPRFVGTTDLGPRGDAIVEMDWMVGQTLDKLEELGIADNTIIIFSSDNGPVLDDGYEDEAATRCGEHRPAGPLRGGKYSLFDGGTRVPFILSWPGQVEDGGSTDALVSHVDFAASFAALAGVELPADSCPDSLNVLDALLGRSSEGRGELVTESTQGKTLFRQGNWIFIPPYEGPAISPFKDIETGNADHDQLYDMDADIGQRSNVADQHPELVAELRQRLEGQRAVAATR